MLQILTLPHGTINLPAFLPDGTQGVVRAVDAQDLQTIELQAVQMNVYHLMQRPGSSTIQALGGLHAMSGWAGPIFTDSGGFQVYSLIRQNPKSGSITNKGATFRLDDSKRKYKFTPEKSIQLQLSYGADMIICLDDCTHPDDPLAVQEESVARTIEWAGRCRAEFDRLLEEKGMAEAERPKLMAVVQGGRSEALRRHCAESLLAIGFDAYGYGGWPLDSDNNLLLDVLGFTRSMIPTNYPMHALGVGHPPGVQDCVALGYTLFDSTMPTRDARHGRLYTFAADPAQPLSSGEDWFRYVYIKDDKHIKQKRPLSEFCDCHTCRHYTLGYLHHLYKLHDNLYPRLATIHNLRFMMQLMENLRRSVHLP